MIILDTSVWIEFFKSNEPYYTKVKELIGKGQVLVIESVFAELLQGAKNNRERELLIGYWENLPKYVKADLFIEAGITSSENKWISKGIGLIDSTIILTSRKSNSKIWTLDKKLKSVLKDIENYKI